MSDRASLDELIAALTPVEREIAALVAEGRSNDDVATRRFVSVKTVEFHLTRIYRKLGVRSRAQLVAVWPRENVSSPLPVPVALMRRAGEPFVGREHERRRLERLIGEPSRPHPAVVISGDSGIGKSMLASWLALLAADAGWIVTLVECDDSAPLALGPIDDLCADLERRLATDRPADAKRLPGDTAALLERVAGSQPVLLVVEDIQWADATLLEHLDHTLRLVPPARLMIVVTARRVAMHTDPAVAGFVANLRRAGPVEHLPLEPFDGPTVHALAVEMLARSEWTNEAIDDVASQVHAATGGLPFLAADGLQGLAGGRQVDDADTSTRRIQSGLHEALFVRAAHVGADALRLMRVGAVVGEEFDLSPVAEVCEIERMAAAVALGRGVANELLIEAPGTDDLAYRFRHSLVRDAVLDDVGDNERAVIHVMLARAIARHDERATERISRHFGLADVAADVDESLSWFDAAAAVAERDTRHVDACRHLMFASHALERRRPADDRAAVALECRLARNAAGAARRDLIDASTARAKAAAQRLGRPELLSDIAIAATMLLRMGQQPPGTLDLLDEAIDHAPSAVLETRLRADRMRVMCSAGLPAPGAADVDALIQLARGHHAPDVLARALLAQCWAAGCSPAASTLRMAATELLSLVTDAPGGRDTAMSMLAWAELCDPGTRPIEAIWDELEAAATRSGNVQQLSVLGARRALHLLCLGRLAEADELLDRIPAGLHPALDAVAVRQLASALVTHARGGDVVEHADWLASSAIASLVSPLPAWARAEQGDLRGARARLDALKAERSSSMIIDTCAVRWNMALLADLALRLDDGDLAQLLWPGARRHAGLGATFITVFSSGPFDRSVAQLASFLGHHDDADSHFARAMAFTSRVGARSWRAQVLLDWATATEDRPLARARAERAERLARRIGLVRVQRRARELLRT